MMTITGTAGDDLLTNVGVGNRLEGLAGDDTLVATSGSTTLVGGEGNDVYRVRRQASVIVEVAGDGVDTVELEAQYDRFDPDPDYDPTISSYRLPDHVENVTLVLRAMPDGVYNLIELWGNALDNLFIAPAVVAYPTADIDEFDYRRYVADLGDGDDTAIGARDATVLGGDGDDRLIPSRYGATLNGGADDDVLVGGNGAVLIGGGGSDRFIVSSRDFDPLELDFTPVPTGIVIDDRAADAGRDRVTFTFDPVTPDSRMVYELQLSTRGDGVEDLFVVAAASDAGRQLRVGLNDRDNRFAGSIARESVTGSGGDDFFDGKGGADYFDGGAGDDRCYGGDGNDTIEGGAGRDNLYGGDGNDVLFGGLGSDQHEGGDGDDILIDGGRGGGDRYLFKGELGIDRVTGFRVGVDGLDFRGAGVAAADLVFAADDIDGDGVFDDLRLTVAGATTVGVVRLDGVTLADAGAITILI